MAFPDRLQLPLSFDPARLACDLDALAAAPWTAHYVQQNYEGDWSVIPLRCAAGETHPIRMIYSDPTATAFVDTPMLAACPYFQAVIAAFACEVRGVRLMRLGPGSVIKAHTDLDLDIESGAARIHVPVVTNPDVEFRLNGSRVEMAAGQAWYLRLSDPHAVANRGTSDRVHLVLDLVANDWLRGLFETELVETQIPTAVIPDKLGGAERRSGTATSTELTPRSRIFALRARPG